MTEMGTAGEAESLSTVISMLANISTTGFIIMFSDFENTTLSRYNNPEFISLNNRLEGLHESVSMGVKIDVTILQDNLCSMDQVSESQQTWVTSAKILKYYSQLISFASNKTRNVWLKKESQFFLHFYYLGLLLWNHCVTYT